MKRVSLPTSLVISYVACVTCVASLGIAEGMSLYGELRERIAKLESEVSEKDRQINRLIVERERNLRRAAVTAAQKNAVTPVPMTLISDDPETELAQAAARAKRGTPQKPDPATAEAAPEEDSGYLGAMTALLTADPRARITRNSGKSSIRYPGGPWEETDPLWRVLGAAMDTESLEKVLILGDPKDAAIQKARRDLSAFGIPAPKLQIRQDKPGAAGIVIELTENIARS